MSVSGRVRIARHSRTGEHAAIKIIDKTFFNTRMSMVNLDTDRQIALLAAEREITVMKLVDHPSILRLHDVWETSSELLLILEYAEGGELFDYLCAKGRLSTSEALGYFQQIMSAVDYCHRLNICHRDLKPENILLDKNHNIKIADFGMAVWQSHEDGLLDTACGSPHYASPEVISGKPYSGAAADIWSCGVILYALLLNKLPFDHEDLPTLLELIMAGQYRIPSDVDPRAADLVRRMLTHNPAKRITMREIFNHPFFVSVPMKELHTPALNLSIDQPLSGVDAIDWHLFANMKALWNDLSQDDLVDKLLSREPTYQKAVYHLLVQYRDKHSTAFDLEAEAQVRQLQHQKRKKAPRVVQERHKVSAPRRRPSPIAVIPPVAIRHAQISPLSSLEDNMDLTSLPQSSPRPSSPLPTYVTDGSLACAPDSSSPTASAMVGSQLGVQLPHSPEINDERVQEFLQQVLGQLQALDARSANATKVPSPDLGSPYPTPLSVEFGIRRIISSTVAPPSTPSGDWFNDLGLHYVQPSTASALSPPLVPYVDPEPAAAQPLSVAPLLLSPTANRPRRVAVASPPSTSRKRSTSSAADKENQVQNPRGHPLGYQETEVDEDKNVDRSAWLMIDKDIKLRPVLKQKEVSPTSPADKPSPIPGPRRRPTRLSQITNTTQRTASGSSTASSALLTPTSPRPLEWIGGLFKGKPVSYQLLSTRDSRVTRDECRRLLDHMGIATQHYSSPSDAMGVLACLVPDELEFGEAAGVAFRIEIRRPTSNQFSVGYAVAAHVVREQGTVAGLKAVYNALRRAWEFDVPVGIFAHQAGSTAVDVVGQEGPKVCFA
jgi:serine/threonine-protein kinase HSL1 (negative regulator of Swe1 kinase)